MASVLETRLRESMVEYYDIVNKERAKSVFAGAYMELPAPEGFFKPNAIAVGGEPAEFTGTVTFNTPSSAAQIYETKVYVYGVEIDRNLLEKTDAISRGAVSRILRAAAMHSISHLDKLLTTLLLTGESAGSLVSGAFFSATSALPGGSTLDNLVGTSVSGSAAEVRAATHAARAHFLAMRGAGNQLMKDGWPRIGLMYDPRATNGTPIHQNVMDALFPDALDGGQIIPAGSVVPMPNGYLSGSIADLWFFDLDVPEKALIVGVQQQPILEANSPNSDSWMVNRRARFVSSWAWEVAFGNPAAAVFGNDA
ncbi:MAG: hypothetical protein M5U25_21165 [Planctomycetota bacterium]|nr:hypothetical protein [Planctomycetota bacterium]